MTELELKRKSKLIRDYIMESIPPTFSMREGFNMQRMALNALREIEMEVKKCSG